MNHVKVYTIKGYLYHGVYFGGKLHLINRIGKVGDCVRY